MKLSSDKFYLRLLKQSDVTQDYVDWMNTPEVVQYTESRFMEHTFASVKEYVRSASSDVNCYFFGIFSTDDLHLGNIQLRITSVVYNRGEIGLIIGRREFWGQGIGSRAIGLVKEWAFSELQLNKLTAGAYSNNQGSIAAFVKNGFEVEGILKADVLFEGEYIDVCRMGCLTHTRYV